MNSYDSAVEQAKKISPWAKVTLNSDRSKWVIAIPTDIDNATTLPEIYRGTPAWVMYHDSLRNRKNPLMTWATYHRLEDRPLEYIAEYYNLAQEEFNQQAYKEAVTTLNWDGDISNEEFSAYKANQEKARALIDTTARKALDERWQNLV